MQIESGIVAIVRFYNFINENLLKEKSKVRVHEGIIEVTQDGVWVALPDFLHEVMIVPKGFTEGTVRKSDLVELYNSLAFIATKKGRVPDYYTESYISPEPFGFTVWSRYPYNGTPGIKKVQTFRLKVRNKLGLII